MKFCCVTPCLNAEKYIEETMRSILEQSVFENRNSDYSLEYIICDGESDDNTGVIARKIFLEFAHYKNINTLFISEKDLGMYDALSKGFKKMSGDIYSYLNAGDYYSPHAFEIVSELFQKQKVQFLTGWNCNYNKHGHLVYFNLPLKYESSLLQKGLYGSLLPIIKKSLLPCVQQESTFWNRNLHKKIDFLRLRSFRLAGDYYLWYTFIQFAQLEIVSAWLGGFKVHNGQLSSEYSKYLQEVAQFTQKPNLFDFFKAFLLRLGWLTPPFIRRKINKNIYYYCFKQEKFKNSRKS